MPITARAFDVLLALVQRAGETIGKDDLLQTVWPDTIVEDANLSQQVFTLRKILGQADDQIFIATVPRRGYRWVAPVHRTGPAGLGERPSPARPIEVRPVRLEIGLAAATMLPDVPSPILALAPDGSRLVFVASDGKVTRLYLRALDRFEPVPMAETEGALHPFFSPDGLWVGFQRGRQLLKLPLDGGPPITLCDVADLRGATWTAAGEIVFAPGPTTGLWRIADVGGVATPLTQLDFEGGERTHRWPHALPDGRVIFTVGRAGASSFDEAMLAITAGNATHRPVLQHATDGRWLPDGRLVWARGATLFAARFNLDEARLTGTPQAVERDVAMSATGVSHFACAAQGTLVHLPGGAPSMRRSLVHVNREGRVLTQLLAGDALEEPRLAPEGARAIVSMRSRNSHLWRYDFGSGASTRLTFDGENFAGIWGPGHGAITYSSSGGGASDLFVLHPDHAAPELLVASEFDKVASSWAVDGSTLAFTEYHPDTGADIWILEQEGERVRPFVHTRFNEYAPAFAPDGRHLAYVTDESGRPEIMVVTYPDGTGKRQVSIEGGTEPLWSRDGRELLFRSGDRLMAVDVSRGLAHARIPTTLFEGRFARGSITLANYDVDADGGFLMVQADAAPPPRALRVTLGWPTVT